MESFYNFLFTKCSCKTGANAEVVLIFGIQEGGINNHIMGEIRRLKMNLEMSEWYLFSLPKKK